MIAFILLQLLQTGSMAFKMEQVLETQLEIHQLGLKAQVMVLEMAKQLLKEMVECPGA